MDTVITFETDDKILVKRRRFVKFWTEISILSQVEFKLFRPGKFLENNERCCDVECM